MRREWSPEDVDEDLHEDRQDALLAWHTEHPGDAVDHLAAPPSRLAIPAYVRWRETGGRVAAGDERTGEAALFNHDERKRLIREAAVNFTVIVLGGVTVKVLW